MNSKLLSTLLISASVLASGSASALLFQNLAPAKPAAPAATTPAPKKVKKAKAPAPKNKYATAAHSTGIMAATPPPAAATPAPAAK
jgi:hypothetical protein